MNFDSIEKFENLFVNLLINLELLNKKLRYLKQLKFSVHF